MARPGGDPRGSRVSRAGPLGTPKAGPRGTSVSQGVPHGATWPTPRRGSVSRAATPCSPPAGQPVMRQSKSRPGAGPKGTQRQGSGQAPWGNPYANHMQTICKPYANPICKFRSIGRKFAGRRNVEGKLTRGSFLKDLPAGKARLPVNLHMEYAYGLHMVCIWFAYGRLQELRHGAGGGWGTHQGGGCLPSLGSRRLVALSARRWRWGFRSPFLRVRGAHAPWARKDACSGRGA